jgi:hypothetical protein
MNQEGPREQPNPTILLQDAFRRAPQGGKFGVGRIEDFSVGATRVAGPSSKSRQRNFPARNALKTINRAKKSHRHSRPRPGRRDRRESSETLAPK